jgi:arylsulfatase A-like enzyme
MKTAPISGDPIPRDPRRARRGGRGRAAPWRNGAALLCGLVLAACGGVKPDDTPARHVIFISLDTARADHFGFYGSATVRTPGLDALARESLVFDDFVTVVPTTLASHTSLFTGKYPHHHGVPRNGFSVDERNVTLAELLEPHGFRSAAFVASFALDVRFGLFQGFDHVSASYDRWAGSGKVMQNERRAVAVTDDVLGYLDAEGVPERLFLFAHYFDPHAPYEPPPPFDTLYDPAGRGGFPSGMDGWKSVARPCNRDGGVRTEGAERLVRQYAGEISYLDREVGRLLDGLRRRGILDHAVLVLTSDHGENDWRHLGCFDHGWSTYQSEIRAVGLVRLPGARHAGMRIDGPLANIDVLPSLLDYLGLRAPGDLDGWAVDLAGPGRFPPADRLRFAQATKPTIEPHESDPRWRNMLKRRSVRRGKYKLIRDPLRSREELYDLDADPDEERNLLTSPHAGVAAIAAELRTRLEDWAASAAPLPSSHVEYRDDEARRRLEALGYAEQSEPERP